MSSSVCSSTFRRQYRVSARICSRSHCSTHCTANRHPSLLCPPICFGDLSIVNVVAVDVFVPRSAQLSCDLTVLRVSVFALMTCCNHNVRIYNDLTFPTPHVYRSHALQHCSSEVMLQLGNRRDISTSPCQQHFFGRCASSAELRRPRARRDH